MELRVMKYFLAVAEEGNITKAADRLHLTQPTPPFPGSCGSWRRKWGHPFLYGGREGLH